jgi:hypothetical protein
LLIFHKNYPKASANGNYERDNYMYRTAGAHILYGHLGELTKSKIFNINVISGAALSREAAEVFNSSIPTETLSLLAKKLEQ